MHRCLSVVLVLCLLVLGCGSSSPTPTIDAVAQQMALNTQVAVEKATAAVLTPDAPEATATCTPAPPRATATEGPTPVPTCATPLKPDALPPADMSGNLLENGGFKELAGWKVVHNSNVPDRVTLDDGGNYVIWERTLSRSDGGSLGMMQFLEVDVSEAEQVELCLDVWVGYHTLGNTGWFAEEHGGISEMPAHVRVDYLDEEGRNQIWNHGFLIENAGDTSMTNYTLVPPAEWRHFCFDLMDEEVRKDPRGQETLPRPDKIWRVVLFGNGWDFEGAVGNALLTAP